ncbi:MAG: DNA internalization-related competence protein ComEC/Rec2, partial [Thiothrix sp.]
FLLLVAPRGVPGRWLGIVLMLPVVTFQPERPGAGAFRVTVLDVGQGLSTVVQTAQHTLVFDSGPRAADSFDTGQLVVLPWLYGAGIRHIDRLMISHADNDHSGGARALLKALPVKQVWTNVPDLLPEYHPVLCRAGQQWEWDGVSFRVLHPSENFSDKHENNQSCVLKVANAEHSILLTADIERVAEYWLLAQEVDLRAEVLLVPHHGSRSSSSPAFIDAVAPRLAILTNGYRNRFRHPHPSVTQRYTDRNIRLLNTVNSGELRLDFPAAAPLVVREWRKAQPRIWLRESMM